jgi:hypothetical protein
MKNLEKVNDLLKEILINKSALNQLELSVIVHIANRWCLFEEERIFLVDDNATEIDEYLVDYLNLINL